MPIGEDDGGRTPGGVPADPAEETGGVELDELFGLDLDWRRWWTILPELIALACTGALPVLVGAGVVSRYTDWFRAPWINDIVGVLFLWIVFLGAAVAVKYGAHVRMSSLVDRLGAGRRLGRAWDTMIRLSPLVMGAILLILGIRIIRINMTRELTWLQIPLGYFSSIIPISGALMIVYTLLRLRPGARPELSTPLSPTTSRED